MSRTDKDRPYRIRRFDATEGVHVDHDHTRGVCRVETLQDAVTPTPNFWRHRCRKRERIVYHCTRKDPQPGCWVHWPIIRESFGCTGHVRFELHPERDCSCDRWPEYEHPTCTYDLDHVRSWYDSAPKWYIDHHWNNPERVRERVELREAVKLANAGEMDDEFDFENRQHRHGASWYYW